MLPRPFRLYLALCLIAALAACTKNDLSRPPVPLGDFVLGHNIVVADHVEKVPISREADPDMLAAAVGKAVDDRFGKERYHGSRIYNIGISVDAYALAPPGIPVVAAPKSVMVISANIWDDATQTKLNGPQGHQITAFEGVSGGTIIGSGYTRTKEEQAEALAFNAVQKVQAWLTEHPEWFGMTPEEMQKNLEAYESKPAKRAPRSGS